MYRILTDEDIRKTLTVKHAINAIELSLRAKNEGKLIAPPRFSVGPKNGSLLFTAGADMETNVIGFRVYDTFVSDSPDRTQLVAVFDGDLYLAQSFATIPHTTAIVEQWAKNFNVILKVREVREWFS